MLACCLANGLSNLSGIYQDKIKATLFNVAHTPDANDERSWFTLVKDDVENSDFCIFLFSQELNNPEAYGSNGAGLISEALLFWQETNNLKRDKMIPICIDFLPDQLERPKGEYEQLQDIIVPMIKNAGVETFNFDNIINNKSGYLREFMNDIAKRIVSI